MKLKKIKGIENPVTCSSCKEKKAWHTAHGHPYGGKTMCQDCAKIERKRKREEDEREETEAEYQINRRLYGN